MITVGIPTWGNKDILWLPMEGLCRQETNEPWELIIMECESFDNTGFEFFKQYWERLQQAGCERLLYIFTGTRKPIAQKWKEIAGRAKGDLFLLQDSDDYSHPNRMTRTREKMAGSWYDTRFYYSYSLTSNKLILFDSESMDKWKTGQYIGIKTDVIKNIPDNDVKKGVHHHFYPLCSIEGYFRDYKKFAGVTTTGANTVSQREKFFSSPYPPFHQSNETLKSIGIPEDVIEKIKRTDSISTLERLKNQRVKVRFTEQYEKFPKGHIRSMTAAAYFNLINYVELTDRELPQYFEKELT